MYIGLICELLFVNLLFLKQALGMFVLILGFVLILFIVSHLDLEKRANCYGTKF